MGGLIRASGWGSQRLASMWASVREVGGLGAYEDKGKDVFRNNVWRDRNCGLGGKTPIRGRVGVGGIGVQGGDD